MSKLKDYDIMDIEAFDDERIKASSNGRSVPATRVYIKAEVDAAIDELKREHHKERHEYIEMVAQHKAKLVEKDKEIAELKEERRWRKCSEEMPKLQEGVSEIFLVVVENESNTSPKGSYVTIAELCDGEWYNDVTGNEIEENIEGSDYFYRSKVSHWMPLPSAPKEGK